MASRGAKIFGNRLFWDQLKSAFHGGARRLCNLQSSPREQIEHEDRTCWTLPGFYPAVTATSIVPGFRPPSRYKARHLDRIRLICNATGFIQAIERGIRQGLI